MITGIESFSKIQNSSSMRGRENAPSFSSELFHGGPPSIGLETREVYSFGWWFGPLLLEGPGMVIELQQYVLLVVDLTLPSISRALAGLSNLAM